MKRSEVWLINLEPTIGAEIRKKRPAIIVNDDDLGGKGRKGARRKNEKDERKKA